MRARDQVLDIAAAFNATDGRGRYSAELRFLARGRHSGVYAIVQRRSGQVLYVGESHSGRLYDTITRHFRKWSIAPGRDAQGRRRGGETYERGQVAIAYALTPPELAADTQYAEIQRLRPRDNELDGCSSIDAGHGACELPV